MAVADPITQFRPDLPNSLRFTSKPEGDAGEIIVWEPVVSGFTAEVHEPNFLFIAPPL
jgi:hypothetical protein